MPAITPVSASVIQYGDCNSHGGRTSSDYKEVHGYYGHDKPGLEVIKLEFILKVKIKRNVWLLADTTRVRKQPIIALYFEIEIKLKF